MCVWCRWESSSWPTSELTEQNEGMKHAVTGDTVAVLRTIVETGIHDALSNEATSSFLRKQCHFFQYPTVKNTRTIETKKSVTGLYQYVIFCGIFTFVCLKWSDDEWKTQSCFFWRQRLMLNQHHLPPEKRVNHNHVVLMRFFFRYYPYFFMNSYLLYLSITLLPLQQGSKVKRGPNVQSCLFEWLKSASP